MTIATFQPSGAKRPVKNLRSERLSTGFTLVELLVVIAIIGILAAVGVPLYQGYQENARIESSKANFARLKSYLSAEITKCNMGTTLVPLTAPAATVTCPGPTAAAYQTYFLAYVQGNFKNPHNPAQAAGTFAAGTGVPEKGQVRLTVDGTNLVLAVHTGATTGGAVLSQRLSAVD